MKKKLSLVMILAVLSSGILTACQSKTTENAGKETANDMAAQSINKENQVDQVYYQKLTFDQASTTLEDAATTLEEKIGNTNREAFVQASKDKEKDTMIALYAEEPIYHIALYSANKDLFEQSNYNLAELVSKQAANLTAIFNVEQLDTKQFLAISYLEENANNQFVVWENSEGVKSYLALGNPENATDISTQSTNAPENESLNKENAVGNTYYQTTAIMYDETNIDSYVRTLEKAAGVPNRKAVINQAVADGNTLFALYGEEAISNLALYTIHLDNFEKANYDTDTYVKQYLQTSDKVMIAERLFPSEYAVIRCNVSEGIPMHIISWTDANNQTQSIVAAYDGKGKE